MPRKLPVMKPLSVVGKKKQPIVRTERQYATGDKRWRKMREAHLHREPFCKMCRKVDILKLATDVDHVDGNPGNNPQDGSNFQSLCHSCHSKKTYSETIGKNHGKHGEANQRFR